MIYKLYNYLKEVRVEGHDGVKYLEHGDDCYESSDACVTVRESKHNEIEFKLNHLEGDYDRLVVSFYNPIENVLGILDDEGSVSEDLVEQYVPNQCLISSDWGTYCLGVSKEHQHVCHFKVNQTHIEIVIDIKQNSINHTYHLVFDKYVPIHPGTEVMKRFAQQLS